MSMTGSDNIRSQICFLEYNVIAGSYLLRGRFRTLRSHITAALPPLGNQTKLRLPQKRQEESGRR